MLTKHPCHFESSQIAWYEKYSVHYEIIKLSKLSQEQGLGILNNGNSPNSGSERSNAVSVFS